LNAAELEAAPIDAGDALARRKRRLTIIRVSSIIVAFGCWEIFGRQINPLFMSYPSKIVVGAITLMQDGVLQTALVESLRTLVLGYVGGALVGVTAGLLVGRYREVEAATDWLINALYATPLVALIPLVILWFGLGFQAKLFIVFLFTLFPVLINTSIGVKNVSRSLIDVAVAFVANERQKDHLARIAALRHGGLTPRHRPRHHRYGHGRVLYRNQRPRRLGRQVRKQFSNRRNARARTHFDGLGRTPHRCAAARGTTDRAVENERTQRLTPVDRRLK
jgi:hypothetical protein